MRVARISSLLLCSLCFLVGGDAKTGDVVEKPVWTLEFIRVTPDKMGLTLGYLDDHWMRVREEAKRQGAVLGYHRISEMQLISPGIKKGDQNALVLLTEYKNLSAFQEREKLFSSIIYHLWTSDSAAGVIKPANPEDLYETEDMRVFMEEPAQAGTAEFKLLAKY